MEQTVQPKARSSDKRRKIFISKMFEYNYTSGKDIFQFGES